MRKFIRDPNTSVNQDVSGSAGRPTGDTPLPIPGSVGQNMQHSYNKRQMFVYGVEDSGAGQPYAINADMSTNPMQYEQQMKAALENASPRALQHHMNQDISDPAAQENLLLRQ